VNKKILVPLDGSELAEVALPYAEELSVKLGVGIELLRAVILPVYSEPLGGVYSVEQEVALRTGAEAYLERVSCRLKEKGIDVSSETVCSTAAEGIIDYASKDGVELIVLATHGHSGITRWALGSVADKVIRGTDKPVVLIRAKGHSPAEPGHRMIKKIVVPLDGSKESEAVIPCVTWLAAGLGAEVVLFQALAGGFHTITAKGYDYTIYPEQQMASDKAFAEDYLSLVGEQLKNKGVGLDFVVRVGDAAEGIIESADDLKADMVAMSTRGRSGVSRWVIGSVAEKVLREGNRPLLLVRAPGDRKK
jgi:nucleotide-binding universal stress UspA family protein